MSLSLDEAPVSLDKLAVTGVESNALPPVMEMPGPAITFPPPAIDSVPLPCRLINAVGSVPPP